MWQSTDDPGLCLSACIGLFFSHHQSAAPLTAHSRFALALWVAALLSSQITLAQTASIRGFITDAADGEGLVGVNVILESLNGDLRGGSTNSDGIYNLTRIVPATYILRVSYVGYTSWSDTLIFRSGQRLTLNIELTAGGAELGEITVEAATETGAARVTAGLQTITPKDMDLLPTPDVSGDLASYLTTLPGVVSLGDRGGQYFIRGGEPSHNMTLIDGMYVYQPYHILGFYSAFPSDIIQQADIHTAGYGAPFTGRISSVIDIRSRNGNKRDYGGTVSLSPFVSAGQFEGPLIRDRLSLIGSVRQSLVEPLAQQYVSQDMPYNFGDGFAKMHGILSANSQLSVSALHTRDRGRIGLESEDRILEEVGWTNTAIGLRYVVLPRALPFIAEILLSYSRMETDQGPADDPVRWARIEGFQYAAKMTSFYERTQWKWGLYWRAPQVTAHLGGLFQDLEEGFSRRHKAGVYLEPDFYIAGGLKARVTLLAELFPGQEQRGPYEARFRVIWQRGEHEVSTGAGWYHQEIFGLHDRRDATNLFTSWRSAPIEELSQAFHTLAGYRVSPAAWLEVSAEVYYKRLKDLFISEWTSFPRFTSRLQRADGEAAGLELRAEVRHRRMYGYVNYGLASVEYTSRQPSALLWFGAENLTFRPPHDRHHQLNLVLATRVRDFDISARWNFGSGRPFNHVYGFDGFVMMDGVQDMFSVEDDQRVIYGRPFRGILPTYHRLDVSVERDFVVGNVGLTAQVGAINLYNRRNLFALDIFTTQYNWQLPIVPTLGMKATFN